MRTRLGKTSALLALVVSIAAVVSLIMVAGASAQAKEIKIGGTMAVTGNFAVEWGPKAKQFMEE
ncbi:MAG TPA: hypothetical protein VII47_14690, partial [Actinomycetota bacterium]